jgi:hypothetical protein
MIQCSQNHTSRQAQSPTQQVAAAGAQGYAKQAANNAREDHFQSALNTGIHSFMLHL